MQLLMDRSTELGNHLGLGHIKGCVERIEKTSTAGSRFKVPHIGWAKVDGKCNISVKNSVPISDGNSYFYFVHSYECRPSSDSNLLATASYHGTSITAIVGRNNVLGVQFHPERSGPQGLSFLSQFAFCKGGVCQTIRI
jgi:glutamine amidotransferase